MTFSPIQNVLGVQPVGTNVTCVNKSGGTLVVGDLVITSFIHAGVVVNPEQAANTSYVFNCVRKASASESGNTGYLGVVTKLLTGVGGNGYNVEVQFGGICTARVLVDATVTPGTLLGISGTAGVLSNTVSNSKYSVTLMDNAAVADGTALKRVYIPSEYEKNLGSGGGAPGSPSGSVQFNNSGAFAGDAGLTYDSTTDVLSVGGDAIINGLQVGKGRLSLSGNVRMGTTNFTNLISGNNNTAIGSDTTRSLSTGANNVMVGFRAGFDMVTATENVVIGFQAGYNCFYGNGNVLVGSGAGQAVQSGGINTFVGKEVAASSAAVTGSDNVGIGAQSLRYLTSGYNNVAVGGQALYNNTTVANNIAIGNVTLYNKTSGGPCTGVGYQALKDCISGEYNTALGNQALVSNMYGNRNVALGEYALDGCKGDNNIGTGINSGYRQWTGDDNVFIGDSAGAGEISGDYLPFNCNYNVAIGGQSMRKPGGTTNAPAITVTAATPGVVTLASHGFASLSNTPVAFVFGATGSLPGGILQNKTYYTKNETTNTFQVSETSGGASIATSSTGSLVKLLYAATAGNGNSCLGYQSGLVLTTGENNVLVGREAGDALTTGTNNTCIGYQADALATNTSNSVTLGNSSISTLRCATQTILTLSDQRDKKDIVDLSSVMPFVNALRPRSFVWNMRDGAKVGIPEIGFIAQELQTAQQDAALTVPNLVNAENPDRLEAGYGALIPILVKAIQELSARVAALEAK